MDHPRGGKIRLTERLEGIFHRLANEAYRRWPRPVPPARLFHTCRIISHRGQHDNRLNVENTLAAFDLAADAGVWGIEMDIRWTGDLIPVVFHDADTQRLFNRPTRLANTPLARIRRHHPLIPTLSEVIQRYGGRLHMMLEIKHEPYPDPLRQRQRLKKVLRHLTAVKDYHLMALHPDMFGCFDFVPPKAFIPIAQTRIDRFSRLAAANGWGGLAGHYLLINRRVLNHHHGLSQGVGTGFVDSRHCLFREVARGVDWIFSNRAAEMQTLCKRHSRE
jgi:glycerophosphoryl diester phosphodiesterase